MFKVGLGFRPVLPFRGRGCGRRTARRSACPRLRSGKVLYHRVRFSDYSINFEGYSEKTVKPWLTVAYLSGEGLLPYRSQKSPQSLGYGSKSDPRELSVDRGQGCNNAMTPGCSLLYGCKFAILKDAAGTLYNVATFILPCSSTSGFRSCGSGYPEFSSSRHSQCVRRSHVPGLF